jgi:hypothetical protein
VSIIQSVEALEAIYGQPNEASTVKVADRITPRYQVLIDNRRSSRSRPPGRKGSIARRAATGPASSACTTKRP